MIFETLSGSAERGELLLVDGGMARYHLRKDGQLTVYEILVLPQYREQGIGAVMLEELKRVPGATSIFARCPADLPSNGWYDRMRFDLEGTEMTRTGKTLNLWRLRLSSSN